MSEHSDEASKVKPQVISQIGVNMATSTVVPVQKPAEKQSEVTLPKLSAEQLAVIYSPTAIVNNIAETWKDLREMLDAHFGIQDEYENPTKHAVETLQFAMKAYCKQEARATVAEYGRALEQWSKDHPTAKVSREEIAVEILDTRGGKKITARKEAAEKLLNTMKK